MKGKPIYYIAGGLVLIVLIIIGITYLDHPEAGLEETYVQFGGPDTKYYNIYDTLESCGTCTGPCGGSTRTRTELFSNDRPFQSAKVIVEAEGSYNRCGGLSYITSSSYKLSCVVQGNDILIGTDSIKSGDGSQGPAPRVGHEKIYTDFPNDCYIVKIEHTVSRPSYHTSNGWVHAFMDPKTYTAPFGSRDIQGAATIDCN